MRGRILDTAGSESSESQQGLHALLFVSVCSDNAEIDLLKYSKKLLWSNLSNILLLELSAISSLRTDIHASLS